MGTEREETTRIAVAEVQRVAQAEVERAVSEAAGDTTEHPCLTSYALRHEPHPRGGDEARG